MSLELLKERFGHSGVIKKSDNREEIHEKLNAQFNNRGDFKSIKDKHQEELEEKDKIIENLETETSELANEVVILKKEKAVLLDNLNKSKWMEDKVHLTAKKLYEDKIKKMEFVDSTKLIPLLISVSRKKQGNTKLNWGNWLKISENKYLFQINESLAKRVFEDTIALIDRNVSYINEKRRRYGGDVAKNYILSFTGDTNASTRRGDLVATDFQPHDYDGAGSSIGASGFTISFWFRPDETVSSGFAVGWKSGEHDRFEFGMRDADQVYFSVASNEHTQTMKNMNDHVVAANSSHGFTEAEMNEMFEGGTEWKTDGTWYHIAVSYVGHENASAGERYRRIYINGRQLRGEGVGSGTDGDFNWTAANRKVIDEGLSFGMRAVKGSGTTVSYNNGLACGLDEVAIYNEVKNSNFIADVYNGQTNYDHINKGGLIAYWKFNEGSGTRLEDFGPYGYHGLLTNDSHGYDGGDSGGWVSGIPTWEEIEEYR